MVVRDILEFDNCLAQKFAGVRRNAPDFSREACESTVVWPKKPINIRLLDKNVCVRPEIRPRNYQSELFQLALEENIIVYLGTGLGKTYIVILFLNSPMIDAQIQAGRKVVFLAPTQDLVQQQAEYIFTKVPYKVRVYCGRTCQTGKHVDKWLEDEWRNQLSEIDILCMTPQIFCSAVVSRYIKWTDFSAVIFDEVHHAYSMKKDESGHPYSKALENYRFFFTDPKNSPKPRMIGLTASLINNMPRDLAKISLGIIEMERRIEGRCVTSSEGVDSKPLMILHRYNKAEFGLHNDIVYELFTSYSNQMKETLGLTSKKRTFILRQGLEPTNEADRRFLDYHERLNLASSGISVKPGSFHKILAQLASIRQSSGLWTTTHIIYLLIGALDKHSKTKSISEHVRPLYTDFCALLTEMLMAISGFLGGNWREILLEFSQPKLLSLLEVLKIEHSRIVSGNTEKSTFSCIIFVQSRVEVLAIYNWLSAVSEHVEGYAFLKAGYAIGMAATAASKWACITKRKSIEQSSMLDCFRRNEINVVVTTSVLEEGIDLPVCSTVIRFDPAKIFRVYVQSRGRARQLRSSFITLVDTDNEQKVAQKLLDFNQFEFDIRKALQSREMALDRRYIPKPTYSSQQQDKSLYEDEVFEAPGLRVDSCTGAVYLNIYCSRLCSNFVFSTGLRYRRYQPTEDTYQTALTLPIGCPITEEIVGNVKATLDLANKSAVVKALDALYKAKELDDEGRPFKRMDTKADELLEQYGLKPDYSALSEDAEGHVTQGEDGSQRECYTYPWRLFRLDEPISRAFTQQMYKLFKVVFEPVENQSRCDTKAFFTSSRLGIIVNATRNTDLWPTKIYSHYGEFDVRYELVSDNLPLHEYQTHNEYFNYTLRIVQNCWSIGKIMKQEFRARCLFYFVPLDSQGSIDPRKLVHSFHLRPDTQLKPCDVVKYARFYCRPGDQQKLFLVKRVRTDLNAMSQIPGHRRGQTFCDYARENYGTQIRDIYQPIIEVAPIAREPATYAKGKNVKPLHSTSSVFYLAEFLNLFEEDAASVYQAMNLPPIVYRIYLSALCSELDQKFRLETKDKRRNVILAPPPPVASSAEDALELALVAGEEDGKEEPAAEEGEAELGGGAERKRTSSDEDSLESESSSLCEEEYDSWEGDSSDEEEEEEEGEPTVEQVSSENWRRFEESFPRAEHLPIQYESSHFNQKFLNTNPKFYSSFGDLRERTSSIQERIISRLQDFRDKLSGDTLFAGDENILSREGPSVDLSIVAPIHFDRVKAVRLGKSREAGVLEALTQRRATENFNLEALENVGDAYLKYCASVVLFKTFSEQHEGALTWARMRLLCNNHFTHLTRRKLLGTYAVTNKFSHKSIASALGATESCKNTLKAKDLADTLESLIGAYLIYCGEFEAILAIHWLGLKLVSDEMFSELHEDAVVFSRVPSALVNPECPKMLELFEQNKKRFTRFQKIINYNFSDASFLIQALTHASAPRTCTKSYERLEFLGDAILDHLVTQTLYASGITKDPGQLTQSRSALVNNYTFAKLAVKYRYDVFVLHANPDLLDVLNTVSDRMRDDPSMDFLTEIEYDKISKFLADIFEAVAGAIYLDSGCSLDTIWSIYYPMMKESIDREIASPTKNIVTQLYEKYPGRVSFAFYRANPEETTEVLREACCIIKDGDKEYKYSGIGLTKSMAKVRAATEALRDGPELPHLRKGGGSGQRRPYSSGRTSRGQSGQRRPPSGPRGGRYHR